MDIAADRAPAASHRWVNRNGVRIHYLDWGGPANGPADGPGDGSGDGSGDGPAVLLLHGVAGNALVWNDVASRLRIALPGHRIVAVDTRDGGATDHPATGYGLAESSPTSWPSGTTSAQDGSHW